MKRRDFVRLSVGAGALSLVGAPASAAKSVQVTPARSDRPARAISLLILGGTGFLGPHLVRYALARGHRVTTFTRGRTEPGLFGEAFREVEALVGDRASDLTALEGRSWDAVIDNSGQRVEWTRDSARLLADSVGRYLYTSSTGVYLPYLDEHIDEGTSVLLEDPPEQRNPQGPSYGVMKALSEIEARRAFGDDRTIVVRPTYIVGPGDPTDRFPYWPVRVERGGEVLVPGKADDPVQWIDVRDLTEWMIHLLEAEDSGTFNVVGPSAPTGMHAFVHGVHAAVASPVTWTYIEDYEFLREQGVRFVIPWIMPVGDYVGSARIDNRLSLEHGLAYRPLATTTADMLAWWHSGAVPEARRRGLVEGQRSMMAREADVLAAWRARGRGR